MTTQMTHIVPACRKTPHPASPTSIFLGCPTDLLWLRMPEAERWHAICPCAVVGEQLALTTGQGFGYRGPSALKTQIAEYADHPARPGPGVLTPHLLCALRWRAPRFLLARCPAIYLVSAERRGTRMRFPHCQHESRGGSRFYVACERSFAAKCSACGRQPLPGATFCNHHGPQPERRLLPHPSRWHLDRRRPRHTPPRISPRRFWPPAPPRGGMQAGRGGVHRCQDFDGAAGRPGPAKDMAPGGPILGRTVGK
jgi:hypothetical protein